MTVIQIIIKIIIIIITNLDSKIDAFQFFLPYSVLSVDNVFLDLLYVTKRLGLFCLG